MVHQVKSIAPGVPIDVLPMGADLTNLFTPPIDPATRRSNEIVFVGRLVEKKGVQHLLEAFELLDESEQELKLTIVGDGPLRGRINARLSGMRRRRHVTLVGSLPHSGLAAVYREATIAVFPFVVAKDGDQEGFGLVIVEAMGCGCPVIASDLPAVHDNVEGGVTGLLTPPGDPTALADALRLCFSDPPLRSTMARAALDSVRRFDWPRIADGYWLLLAKHL
jgi:glycosyltransferase involved in cell wall biosynthesis